MKKLKTWTISFVVLCILFYLAWSFCEWTFSPFYWSLISRIGYCLVCFLGGFFLFAVVESEANKKIKINNE